MSRGDADRRYDLVLQDYHNAREDERTMQNVQGGILSVAVTLMGGLAALLLQTCQLAGPGESCSRVPDIILAGAPLAPLAVLCYLLLQGTIATIRSYYLRALEDELAEYAGRPFDRLPGVTPASYVRLVIEATSLRAGRGRPTYRLISVYILAVVLVIFGGLTLYIALHVSRTTRLGMAVVYGPAAAVMIVESYFGTAGGRSLIGRVLKGYHSRTGASEQILIQADSGRVERSLAQYLLLPRPGEAIKWAFLPGAWLICIVATPATAASTWTRMAAIWFVLEFFAYQARYQWNDIRGLRSDRVSPARLARGRLPAGETAATALRALQASTLVLFIRIAAVGVAVLAAPPGLRLPLLVVTSLVFLVAGCYEYLRARPGRTQTHAPTPTIVGIWCIVGIGYAIRAGTGAYLAGERSVQFHAVLAATMTAFGVMFVTMTWALEATSNCVLDKKGQLRLRGDLSDKPHLVPLLRIAVPSAVIDHDQLTQRRGRVPPPGQLQRHLAALKQITRLTAPWHLALCAAAPASALLGRTLATTTNSIDRGPGIAAAVVGLVAAVTLTRLQSAAMSTAVLVASAAALAFLGGAKPQMVATVPWLVVALGYLWFRHTTYAAITAGFQPLLAGLRAASKFVRSLLVRILVGNATWQWLTSSERPATPGRGPARPE